MGQITWGSYTPRNTNRVRKLMLEKDEQARVCFLDTAPRTAYVHTFEKVITGANGKPIIKMDEWPDGSPREVVKTEYAGKFRCLGDEEEIQTSGADPENCAACRAHIQHPNAVKRPVMRVLGRVLKYNTREGSFNPTKPFSATLLVWDLTEKRFGEVNDIFLEHGPLAKKDLLLGPCDNKQMQKYTISVGNGEAAYLATKETQRYVVELLEEEKIENIMDVAGKLPSAFEMEQKVQEVVRAYSHAFGQDPSGTEGYDSQIGESNVEQVTKSKPKSKPKPPEKEEAEDLFSSDEDDDDEVDVTSTDSSDDVEEDDDDQMTASLDDLLNSFK